MTFSSKILHTEGASDLVAPQGVTLKSDDIELAGQEPTTQASIYRIKTANFKVEVEGTGSLTPQADVIVGSGQRRAAAPGSQASHL